MERRYITTVARERHFSPCGQALSIFGQLSVHNPGAWLHCRRGQQVVHGHSVRR